MRYSLEGADIITMGAALLTTDAVLPMAGAAGIKPSLTINKCRSTQVSITIPREG